MPKRTNDIYAYTLQLIREEPALYTYPIGEKTDTTIYAAHIAAQLLEHADREHFLVFLLNTQHRIIGVHTAHVGTLDASLVSARDVYKIAILANAKSILLAHNHPSGHVTPSNQDRQMTARLVQAGALLDITVLDHVIIGYPLDKPTYIYYSFAEQNMLKG